jgi:membrane protein implicated in regulation of membrane protease activity
MNPTNRRPAVISGLIAGSALGFCGAAAAYVGPGAGLSLLGALWAVAVAVFAALFFVVMWPVRRMMKRRKALKMQAGAVPPDATE